MPCICWGAISGEEFLGNHQEEVAEINAQLDVAIKMIEALDRKRRIECNRRSHLEKWEECWKHKLYGCEERGECYDLATD